MAEHFRDEGRDVLLFIDNIFRFVMSGSEVSALLGRMPSAVGYQPTLGTEMGELQERNHLDQKGINNLDAGGCTSRPTTIPTPLRWRPLPTLDATIALDRAISEKSI